MGMGEEKAEQARNKAWSLLCRMPFWQTTSNGNADGSFPTSSPSSALGCNDAYYRNKSRQLAGIPQRLTSSSSSSTPTPVSSIARSLIPHRRRLSLDPPTKLYFPYEPGKQARSAVSIKNICKSPVAFKFQTTAPKSCYMRPPGGILAPGESLIAAIFKFVEPPENYEKPRDQKSKVKFKIMSLKMKERVDYVPELFEEQKDEVAVEQILCVVFLDPDHPCPALEKLKRQIAEAEAALETCKRPSEEEEESGPRIVGGGQGLVIDEWKERRERYLARQQIEEGVINSV